MDPKKRSMALMLNLFVFPGAGQVYLGRKLIGYVLMILSIAFLAYLLILFGWSFLHHLTIMKTQGLTVPALIEVQKTSFVAQKDIYLSLLGTLVFLWILSLLDLLRK